MKKRMQILSAMLTATMIGTMTPAVGVMAEEPAKTVEEAVQPEEEVTKEVAWEPAEEESKTDVAKTPEVKEEEPAEKTEEATPKAEETKKEETEPVETVSKPEEKAATVNRVAAPKAAVTAIGAQAGMLGVARSGLKTDVLEMALDLAEPHIASGEVDQLIDEWRVEYYAACEEAREILEKVQNGDASVTQEQIDNSMNRVMAAVQHLSYVKGDPTNLQAAYDKAAEINLDDYMLEGQEEFKQAMVSAKTILDTASAYLQKDMDKIQKLLEDAMANLKPDKSGLEDLVAKAESMDKDGYTDESLSDLEDALNKAKDVIANEDATVENVKNAEKDLQDALDNLVVDKSGLEDLVAKVENMDKDGYTDESLSDLEDALNKAKDVIANEDATVEDVKNAEKDLQDALDSLKPDKSGLEDLVDKAESMDKDGYTDESLSDLEDALNNAKDVIANEDATVEDVKNAEKDLQDALDNLKPDKGNLGDLIDEAEKEDKDNYDDDTWKDLQDALEKAKDVYEDENATLDDVKKAEQGLKDALAAAKDNEGDQTTDKKDDKKDNKDNKNDKKDNKNNKDSKKAAKTGDAANTAAMAGLMAAAAAAIAAFRKKEK